MSEARRTPRPNAAAMRKMIRAAKGGNADQRANVLEVFRPYLVVRSFAKLDARVQTKVAPSDAAQQTIIKALDGFEGFKGTNPDSLLRWLTRIHTNCVHDIHRHYLEAERRSVVGEERLDGGKSRTMLRKLATAIAPSLSPSEIANVQDRSSRVRAALGKLSPQQQQVLEMRELRGLSYEAIGEKLGIGPTAARQTRVRALRSLARILKQDDTR